MLGDSHPFFCKQSNKRITQVPSAQAATHGGIIFATRSMLGTFTDIKPPSTTLILLPGFRGSSGIDVPATWKVLAPQQVVVHEPGTKVQYKRLVMDFKIDASPNDVAITSVKFCDLVIEFHSCLISQHTSQALADHPLSVFKKALAATVSLVELSVYSYRAIKTKELNTLHQAIIKVPQDVVKDLLVTSGSGELFIRMFVNDNDQLDHSILTRYWACTLDELRQFDCSVPPLELHFVALP